MSTRRILLASLATMVGGATLAVGPGSPPAVADVTSPAAGTALDLPSGVTVSGMSGDPASRAIADTLVDPIVGFNDFPSKGSSYLMLSSGNASQAFQGSASAQLSTDFGNDAAPDSSSISLTVAQGTAGAGCLFLDFALGTEEPTGYTAGVPDDELNIELNGVEYAVNAGDGYFTQNDPDTVKSPDWPVDAAATYYHVNQIEYWHQPGSRKDPEPGTAETPHLPAVTGLNNLTSLDTARIPLDLATSNAVITVTVRDAPGALNGDLDSVGFVDNVRLGASCANGSGVEPIAPDNQEPGNACCGIIRGTRGVGNTLTYDPVPSTTAIERYDSAQNGWRSPSGTPVGLRFRWYSTTTSYRYSGDMRHWTALPNADRQTYVPTPSDRARVLIVLVTGVVDGRRYETFPSTDAAPNWYVTTTIQNGTFLEGVAPVISGPEDGTASVGDTLTAQVGDTVPRQDTWDWQWYAKTPGQSGDGAAISGATGQTFVIGEAQAGKMMMVKATAKRDNFDSKTWPSAFYGPIDLQTWQQTPKPAIVHDGTPAVNEELSVATGAWNPVPASYSYQWKRDGVVISGAVYDKYTVKAADVGKGLTVDVSGVITGYPQLPQTSAAVTPAGGVLPGGTAAIIGTAKVGSKLTASLSGWPTGLTYTYSWYAGSTVLQSGTSRYYSLPASVLGKQITLKVTGTKSGFEPTVVASAPTAVVARGSLISGSVRMSGTLRVGYTLRAYVASWGPSPVVYRYRWKIGSSYVAGSAGTRSSLKLPSRARGKRITLEVAVSKTGYASVVKRVVSTSTVR